VFPRLSCHFPRHRYGHLLLRHLPQYFQSNPHKYLFDTAIHHYHYRFLPLLPDLPLVLLLGLPDSPTQSHFGIPSCMIILPLSWKPGILDSIQVFLVLTKNFLVLKKNFLVLTKNFLHLMKIPLLLVRK